MADRTGPWLGRTLAALVLTSCVAAGADVALAADTIKVGFMAPMTGIARPARTCSRDSSWPSSRSGIDRGPGDTYPMVSQFWTYKPTSS